MLHGMIQNIAMTSISLNRRVFVCNVLQVKVYTGTDWEMLLQE